MSTSTERPKQFYHSNDCLTKTFDGMQIIVHSQRPVIDGTAHVL
jgi:hypothetical protein